MLHQSTLGDETLKFIDIKTIVYIDEKWFNMTKILKK